MGERNLPQRRTRARLFFLIPCLAIWILGGLTLQGIADLLSRFGPSLAVALIAAIAWQLSLVKQMCLNGHHKRPSLAAFGYAADRDALRFGTSHALWCFGSCWALMLLPFVLSAGQLAIMAAVSIWIWAEQFDQPTKPSWRIHLPTTGIRVITHRLPSMSVAEWAGFHGGAEPRRRSLATGLNDHIS
jgi:predicted metal-binding membrane protein